MPGETWGPRPPLPVRSCSGGGFKCQLCSHLSFFSGAPETRGAAPPGLPAASPPPCRFPAVCLARPSMPLVKFLVVFFLPWVPHTGFLMSNLGFLLLLLFFPLRSINCLFTSPHLGFISASEFLSVSPPPAPRAPSADFCVTRRSFLLRGHCVSALPCGIWLPMAFVDFASLSSVFMISRHFTRFSLDGSLSRRAGKVQAS